MIRVFIVTMAIALGALQCAHADSYDCPNDFSKSGVKDNRLYALSETDNGEPTVSELFNGSHPAKGDSFDFAYALRSGADRDGGMILVKISDYSDRTHANEVPERVSLDRNATVTGPVPFPLSLFFGSIRLPMSSSVPTDDYEIFHRSRTLLGLTGGLQEFHTRYQKSDGVIGSTYEDPDRRMAFAFAGLDLKKRVTDTVVGRILKGTPLAFVTVAYAAEPTGDGIGQLRAKLRYYPKVAAGEVTLFCFSYQPSEDARYSRIEIHDLDGKKDGPTDRSISRQINWSGNE